MKGRGSLEAEELLKISGKFLAMQSALGVLPSEERIGEYAAQAFLDIPGVEECGLCLAETEKTPGNLRDNKCAGCPAKSASPYIHAERYSCAFSDERGYAVFPMEAPDTFFGYLIIKYAEEGGFFPLEQLVRNMAGAVAAALETRLRRSALEKLNEELKWRQERLETLVRERTSELARANERLHEDYERLVRTEAELRESRDLFESVENAIGSGSWRWDLKTYRITISGGLRRLMQISEEEFDGSLDILLKRVHPDDIWILKEAAELVRQGKASPEIEYRLVLPGGAVKHVRAEGKLVFDENGAVESQLGFIRDVTARRKQEKELHLARFSMANVADSIYWLNRNGKVLDVNKAACENLGYSHKELLRMSAWEFEPDLTAEKWPDRWSDLKSKKFLRLETGHRTKSGDVYPVEVAANYLEHDGMEYYCAIARDITERKRTERAMGLLVEGTAEKVGEEFFTNLVRSMALAAGTRYAFISELTGAGKKRARVISMWDRDSHVTPFEYGLKNTPCEKVAGKKTRIYRSGLGKLFPKDEMIQKEGIESYLAIPLFDPDGAPIGHMGVMDVKPLPEDSLAVWMTQIFAARAGAELQRMITERALKRSEEISRRAQEVARLGIWEWNIETGELIWSAENCRLFGFDPASGAPTYETFLNGLHSDEKEIVLKAIDDAISGKRPYRLEHRVVRPDGTVRTLLGQAEVIRDAGGRPLKMLGTGLDITESKLAEKVLRVTSEITQARMDIRGETDLLKRVCDIIVNVGGYRLAWVGLAEDDEKKSVRPAAYAGFEEGYLESIKITWGDSETGRGPTGTAIRTGRPSIARHIETDPNYTSWREQARARGYSSSVAVPLANAGQRIGALNIYSAEPDAFDRKEVELLQNLADSVTNGIINLRATADREKAERALRESEERYRNLVEKSQDPVFRTDTEGRFTYVNPAWEKALGYKSSEMLGRRFLEFETPEQAEKDLEKFRSVLAGQDIFGYETTFVAGSGLPVPMAINASRLKDAHGSVIGTQGVAHDIAETKKKEAELLRAKIKAEEASAEKDKYMSLIAHDLRTPLTSMLSFMKLLSRDDSGFITEEKKQLFDSITNSGERAIDLIDHVLHASRFESGRVVLKPSFLDAHIAALAAIALLGHLARKKGIEMDNEIPESHRIYADSQLLGEVLNNLVSNAIKFCRNGDRITVSIHPDEPSTLVVRDTGAGMAPETLANIFRRDVKTTEVGTAGETGTGLALPLCKEIVEAHGGEISAESEPGKGSVFYVRLPYVKPEVALAIGDGAMRRTMAGWLGKINVNVIEARSARELLEKAECKEAHLVLMDLEPPDMSGIEALRTFKQNRGAAETPVIVITPGSDIKTWEKAIKAGADDFITRPVYAEDLIAKIRKFII